MIFEQNKCWTGEDLLGPPVETVGVGADVVQSHLGLGLLGVRLEEYCFSMTTLGAGMILRTDKLEILFRTCFLFTSDLGRVGSDTTSVTMLVMASTSCMILFT